MKTKSLLIAIAVAVATVGLGFAPNDADARRLGGGRTAGMQRTLPAKPADAPPAQTPAQGSTAQAPSPAVAPAAAGAAAGKRSWMAPIAGLAAGLGIAALLSHFGLGAGLANFVTLLLLAVLAVVAVRWLLRRFAPASAARPAPSGLQFAQAGARGMPEQPLVTSAGPSQRIEPVASLPATDGTPPATAAMPGGFDAEAFRRIAKQIFVRLQAANDAGQLDDLRRFTTPELFASLRVDLHERGNAPQQTDVVQLDAEVLDAAREGEQWIVSVRFHGLIREQAESPAAAFDEVWHLVKPTDGSREWAIAGIAPAVAA